MAVVRSGITYGCSNALEAQADALVDAGKRLAAILKGGGTLPAKWFARATVYDVVKINVTPDGTTSNQSAISSAVTTARSGTPTILVLPPADNYYRTSGLMNLSDNTHVVGYGATVHFLDDENVAWKPGNNSSLLGINFKHTDDAISRWPERFENNNYTAIGSKNGSYANALDDGNDSSSIHVYYKNSVIVADCHGLGTIQGFVRNIASTEVYYLRCSTVRTHSDSIHITKESGYITLRECHIFDGGDDCISIVQYDSALDQPHNIYLDNCRAWGGRTRGFTCIGARDVLYRRCIGAYTTMAPFRHGATAAHAIADTTGIIHEDCLGLRGSQWENTTHDDQAVLCTLIANATYDTTGVVFDNKCRGMSWDSDPMFGLGAVEQHASGGTITITTNGASEIQLNEAT